MQKMWYIYTMEYYSAIRNNEFMKFLSKWMELENIILGEVIQTQKINHGLEKMAQWLRALSALPEVMSSNPSNHMLAHNHL